MGVDFKLTPAQEAFREEIRGFLRSELAAEPRRVREDGWVVGFSRAFSEKLGRRGWLGLTWPREYGGQARSVLERLILTEELLRAGAPVAAHWLGDRQVGPSILRFGTAEQRREILPRITSGAIVFCVGLSEPNAGSDAAAVTTQAVEDGDGFVIRGQKIWTSFAHQADYCYLVARTDASGPKHKGISEFIVPMATPGITVRPLLDMTGEHHFNEVFFEDVRVPADRADRAEGPRLVPDRGAARLRARRHRARAEQLAAAGGRAGGPARERGPPRPGDARPAGRAARGSRDRPPDGLPHRVARRSRAGAQRARRRWPSRSGPSSSSASRRPSRACSRWPRSAWPGPRAPRSGAASRAPCSTRPRTRSRAARAIS